VVGNIVQKIEYVVRIGKSAASGEKPEVKQKAGIKKQIERWELNIE